MTEPLLERSHLELMVADLIYFLGEQWADDDEARCHEPDYIAPRLLAALEAKGYVITRKGPTDD